MNIQELYNRVNQNTINIHTGNHRVDISTVIADYIEKTNTSIEIRKASNITNDTILEFYQDILTRDIDYGKPTSMFVVCPLCDTHMHVILLDDNNIILVDSHTMKPLYSMDYISLCPAKRLLDNNKLEAIIKVDTGSLVFQNCFINESLRRMPTYNSICTINGIDIEMQYLASVKNVGYVQLTNTSVELYRKGDEILVCGKSYYEDEDDEYEFIEYDIEGYEHIGDISCDVWRIMCADISVLESHNEEINDYDERITVDVTPGKYLIENIYILSNEDRGLLARISKC